MGHEILLPNSEGKLEKYRVKQSKAFETHSRNFANRVAYAAPHVVANTLVDVDPIKEPAIDWDSTMGFRKHLWSHGLQVAEAMDTSQRGMGLDWKTSQELIKNTLEEARLVGGGVACGAGTDHINFNDKTSLNQIVEAYLKQCEFIEAHGGNVILMASPDLAKVAKGPEDYMEVYNKVLSQLRKPVILHWLGEMFNPRLKGYWGHKDVDVAMDICLDIITRNADKIDGIKMSLLDEDLEIKMRRRLPKGVRMYTGDDFNYPTLIEGDQQGYSDALLGIFDAIAPAASAALYQLDQGNTEKYREILDPTVPLSRHIFKAPTFYYKVGVVFLAYLNGFQSHFRMIGGMESARNIIHLSELFVLADEAGLLQNQDLATERMKLTLQLAGIDTNSNIKVFK